MDNENFDRQYRMAAGPAGGEGFEVGATGEGQPSPLHISFRLEKSDLETQNTGKIEIWNLSPEHNAVLEASDCCVSLRAGYGNRMALIFAGIVSFVSRKRDGADIKTTIEVTDNLIEVRDTYVTLSYNGLVNWKTVFDDLADQMGVVPVYSYNAQFTDLPNGYSYVGLAKNALTKGCDCCGLSWSIQNGILQVKVAGDAISTQVYVLNAESGMIGSPEKVAVKDSDDSTVTRTGWDVEYLLNGAIDVNDYVRLESTEATGYFYVYSLQIEGDNVSGDWMCKARLLELAGSGGDTDGEAASASTSEESYRVSTSGSNLMLRDGPGTGNTVLAKMPNGTVVTSDGQASGGWLHVLYNGTWGYASANYLEKV